MNYPDNTIVQNYNVSAGRVIQLPCFLDQAEPPDGFRAVVFATPTIGLNGPYVNQTGPAFSNASNGALLFDLTQLMQQNALSRARSIFVSVATSMSDTGGTGNDETVDLLLDSGLWLPIAPMPNAPESFGVFDFLSANPIFALYANVGLLGTTIADTEFTVAVANFKLNAAGFSSGSFSSGV